MIDKLLNIVLIEDNPADVEMTLDALKEINLANRVKVLKDGAEAVDYIFRQGKYSESGIAERPTIILLDMNLPKIDGLEILRRMRANERTKSIPVVVLASSPTDQNRIESYNLGVNSYITKPVRFDSFTKAISQIGLYWAVLNEPLE